MKIRCFKTGEVIRVERQVLISTHPWNGSLVYCPYCGADAGIVFEQEDGKESEKVQDGGLVKRIFALEENVRKLSADLARVHGFLADMLPRTGGNVADWGEQVRMDWKTHGLDKDWPS